MLIIMLPLCRDGQIVVALCPHVLPSMLSWGLCQHTCLSICSQWGKVGIVSGRVLRWPRCCCSACWSHFMPSGRKYWQRHEHGEAVLYCMMWWGIACHKPTPIPFGLRPKVWGNVMTSRLQKRYSLVLQFDHRKARGCCLDIAARTRGQHTQCSWVGRL